MNNEMNKECLIGIESKLADHWNNGRIAYLTHFSGGNEEELIRLFSSIGKDDWVFSGHRSHYHFLLKGGDSDVLEEEVLCGRSMFLFSDELKFVTSSILAGNAGIAAGVAHALKLKNSTAKVWCFLGDGAEEQGHFYEAVMYVEANQLPCTFIVEDNNRSVDVARSDRRGTYLPSWPKCVIRYFYEASYPHAGTDKWVSLKHPSSLNF